MNHRDISRRHTAIVAGAERAEAIRWAQIVGLLAVALLIMIASAAIIIIN